MIGDEVVVAGPVGCGLAKLRLLKLIKERWLVSQPLLFGNDCWELRVSLRGIAIEDVFDPDVLRRGH